MDVYSKLTTSLILLFDWTDGKSQLTQHVPAVCTPLGVLVCLMYCLWICCGAACTVLTCAGWAAAHASTCSNGMTSNGIAHASHASTFGLDQHLQTVCMLHAGAGAVVMCGAFAHNATDAQQITAGHQF